MTLAALAGMTRTPTVQLPTHRQGASLDMDYQPLADATWIDDAPRKAPSRKSGAAQIKRQAAKARRKK
jgi:hypothetical protein